MLRAVLTDLGDTLVHLDRPWDDVFRANLSGLYSYLAKFGLDSDFRRFAKVFIGVFEEASATAGLYKIEIPMQDIISRALRKLKFRSISEGLVEAAMVEFYAPEIEAWQLFPDTVGTLAALRERGFEMGLVSNAKSDWAVRSILEKFGLQAFFGVIVTSAALRIRKPRVDIFVHALAALKVRAAETAFVGDSLDADMLGARIAGMHSIHLLREPGANSSLVRPEATVRSLSEALHLITAWNKASS